MQVSDWFLPEETYFFQDGQRNLVSYICFHFFPEEMEEAYRMGPMMRVEKAMGIKMI